MKINKLMILTMLGWAILIAISFWWNYTNAGKEQEEAEIIRSNIEKMQIPHKKSLPRQVVTLSLGVTTSEETIITSYEGLIKHADMALSVDGKSRWRPRSHALRGNAFRTLRVQDSAQNRTRSVRVAFLRKA